jgi:hypothetical protein
MPRKVKIRPMVRSDIGEERNTRAVEGDQDVVESAITTQNSQRTQRDGTNPKKRRNNFRQK